MTEIDKLRQLALTQEWSDIVDACKRIAEIGGDEALAVLVSLLEADRAATKNGAAIGLRYLGDARAVEPLLRAAQAPVNETNHGTFVYALEALDCRHHLREIFEALCYGSFEAKCHASNILDEQEFEFTREDLLAIDAMWEDCKQHPEKCPAFETCQADIESDVRFFMAYLNQ